MRVVVRRLNETVELCYTGGQWVSENGERIEVECLIADGKAGTEDFCSRIGYRTSTATH
jgi:hypothetical protein